MSDVSCRVISDLLEYARIRAIADADLLHGVETIQLNGQTIPESHFRNPRNYVPWEFFRRVCENISRVAGDDHWGPDFAAHVGPRAGMMTSTVRSVARFLISPKTLYWASQKFTGPSNFKCIKFHYEDLGKRKLKLTMELPSDGHESNVVHLVGRCQLEKIPNVLGLPDAFVELEIAPGRGIYTVILPTSASFIARIRRALEILFHSRKIIDELEVQDRLLEENYRKALDAQAELQVIRRSLERAVEERTLDLQHKISELTLAKNEADMANNAKSTFLANMSHDLRTPLTAILGFTEILRRTHLSDIDRQKHANTIARNGLHLLDLINDILEVSRIEAKGVQVSFETFSPHALVNEVVELLGPTAAGKGLGLTIAGLQNIPESIISDASRVRQILNNVIGNAIKFTDSGLVKVECSYEVTDDQHWLDFKISDSGRGIDTNDQFKLFKPFSQLDVSTTKKYGGTGLGLHLSETLARLLGGDVALLRSEVGRGSTFLVRLRDYAQEKNTSPNQIAKSAQVNSESTKHSGNGKRVLLVEDHPDNQMYVKIVLERLEYTVVAESNGRTGLERALSHPFDIILLDMQLPEIDGYNIAKHIRSKGMTVPIIALTAFASSEDRERSLSAGCSDFLSKPINEPLLLNTMDTWLRQ